MNKILRYTMAAVALPLIHSVLTAQIVINTVGQTYTENFDAPVGVTTTNGNFTWTDNATIPGWFSQDPAAGIESQFPGGISATQRVYSFRYTAANAGAGSGRAFGTRTINAGTFSFAVGLTNNTGETLTQFDVSFVTALWRTPNNNTTDTLSIGYAITTSGTWTGLSYTNVPTLGHSYEQGATGGATNADPNDSGLFWNKSATISDLNWAPGDTLYIRFLDGNGAAAWGIDNFSMTAVPEPRTYAFLMGLTALGVIVLRRRLRR